MQSEGKVGRPADNQFMFGGGGGGCAECAESLFDSSVLENIGGEDD